MADPGGHLINWLGHSAGALVFGLLLGLLWRDGSPGRNKAIGATALALLWNLAELMGLWQGGVGPGLAAVESTAFSLLPALLFDLVIGGAPAWAVRTGYALGIGATAVHCLELVSDSAGLHGAALAMVAAGFCGLAVYAAVRSRNRALPALALLLLSLSILHFAEDEAHTAWWVELVVHHAGIPLAMYVLLKDYRFVFLDALVRFLANILVAAVFAGAAGTWMAKWPSTWFAGLTGLFILYSLFRGRVQGLLTRLAFGRSDLDGLLRGLRPVGSESDFVDEAERALRAYFGAGEGAEATLEVRLASGAVRRIGLGRRTGGRPYLSEDLQALRLAGERIREGLEEIRSAEMRRLVAEAELRALQAQINPHFLFNALNTLYGMIPREAAGARGTVLNLADLFRYLFGTSRTFVSIDEELKIVRAYLAVEGVRLGDKLLTELEIEGGLGGVQIPLLSVEPLVENAVKHGVSGKACGGTVGVRVKRDGAWAAIEVWDTGVGFTGEGGGVGLQNVRKRLRLCYGEEAELKISSSEAGTTVAFRVPVTE